MGFQCLLTTTFLSADKLAGQGLSSGGARSLRGHTQYSKSHKTHYEIVITHIKSGWMAEGCSKNWSMKYQDESLHQGFQIYV